LLLLPAYETEKDDAAGRLAEIENELESAVGEDREDLIKEKEALISVLRKTEKKIADADRMLDYAQRGMGDEGDADSYAVSVCEDPGYSSFESNVDIVSNVSRVFPVFFFLIAALVCMTTMTRMIDEQRSQIGVL
jgi:putative ABC transport system permease protein